MVCGQERVKRESFGDSRGPRINQVSGHDSGAEVGVMLEATDGAKTGMFEGGREKGRERKGEGKKRKMWEGGARSKERGKEGGRPYLGDGCGE